MGFRTILTQSVLQTNPKIEYRIWNGKRLEKHCCSSSYFWLLFWKQTNQAINASKIEHSFRFSTVVVRTTVMGIGTRKMYIDIDIVSESWTHEKKNAYNHRPKEKKNPQHKIYFPIHTFLSFDTHWFHKTSPSVRQIFSMHFEHTQEQQWTNTKHEQNLAHVLYIFRKIGK